MNKKYFFFDIDGTLTDNNTKKIVPSALQALRELEMKGHFVAIATGRAHYKARRFMDEVGLKNMVCSGGGALVINNELQMNIPLDLKKAKAICKQAEALGYGLLLMLDDSIDCYAKNDLFREQVKERKEPTNYIIDPNLDFDQLPAIYKIYVSIPKEEEERLTLKNTLGHLRFVEEYLMFQYDEKKQGIIDMMEHLHADCKDVVVFGDDYNDLVMFDPQWFSIAMGNACDSLKEKADYVTDKNIDDGIYHACKKFGWI
ncbi:MAG: HAD family phosphatase [Erysipelotrichia bacterium]|nr:HAD family phosphatase [Erysipelotrichia bacterium]